MAGKAKHTAKKPAVAKKPPIDITAPKTVTNAMSALALVAVQSRVLQESIVCHHMALDGAFAGIERMKLGGEDATAYASVVVNSVEGLADAAAQQSEAIYSLAAFFTHNAKAMRRLRVAR